MLPLAAVSLPIRPATAAATAWYLGAVSAGAVLGLWWLLRRRPTWRDALVFVACADLILLVGSLTQSGFAPIAATMYFGMLAVLVAFLLGWRILLLHCLFSAAAVVAATMVTMRAQQIGFREVYPVVAPAATIAIALPLIVQFVVEAGRRGIGQVTVERDHDTLTGLYGRRGLDAELRRLLRGDEYRISVVALLDLDGFKAFNDAHGHQAGDQQLVETAIRLRSGLPSAVLARMGGRRVPRGRPGHLPRRRRGHRGRAPRARRRRRRSAAGRGQRGGGDRPRARPTANVGGDRPGRRRALRGEGRPLAAGRRVRPERCSGLTTAPAEAATGA